MEKETEKETEKKWKKNGKNMKRITLKNKNVMLK